jgi:hypothetical protein
MNFTIELKKEGRGVYTWPDGRKYDGGWHGDQQHGEGLYTTANGRERRGIWAEGKRVKWLD